MTAFSTRVTFDHVRNSSAGFTSTNPVLGYGVTGLETDTGYIKIGDGVTPWNDLVYSTAEGTLSVNGITAQTITIAAGKNVSVATASSTITISAAGDVASVNGITGTIAIAAGKNVTVSTSGSTITVSAAGEVVSVNDKAGAVVLSSSDVTAAPSTHASQHRTGGSDVVLPVVTSATITASVNNYSPPTGDIIRLSSTATGTAVITGLSGGVEGAVRVLANVGTNTIRIAHANTNSGLTNRFAISGGADITLDSNAQAQAWYDDTSDVWRVSNPGSTAADGIVSVNGITATAVVLTSASVSAASAVHTHTTSEVTGLDARIVYQATNAAIVRTLSGLTGTITLTGVNLTVATAAGEITLTAGGGAGGIVSVNGQTATAVTLSAASVTAASTAHSATHQSGGSDELLPLITSVAITASVNDYALPVGDIFRISHAGTNTVNITGLATAVDGSAKLLVNVSTGASSSYTIKHANTNSTAVSQFLVPWAGDYVVSPNGGVALVLYDGTDQRWRVV